MDFKLHTVTQKFMLNDEERKKVVYASPGPNYDAQWSALEKIGASMPGGASEIKVILWDPEDGGCLVTWRVQS